MDEYERVMKMIADGQARGAEENRKTAEAIRTYEIGHRAYLDRVRAIELEDAKETDAAARELELKGQQMTTSVEQQEGDMAEIARQIEELKAKSAAGSGKMPEDEVAARRQAIRADLWALARKRGRGEDYVNNLEIARKEALAGNPEAIRVLVLVHDRTNTPLPPWLEELEIRMKGR